MNENINLAAAHVGQAVLLLRREATPVSLKIADDLEKSIPRIEELVTEQVTA